MIRIYIGTNPDGSDKHCTKVLEHSINANTREEVEFVHLGDGSGSTGFSNSRWQLSQGRYGMAIYLDSDMLVLGDIGELFSYAERGVWVGCFARKGGINGYETPGSCVSVVDCTGMTPVSSLKGCIQSGQYIQRIPESWNTQDRLVEDGTNLVHFTQQKKQPWKLEAPKDRECDKLWLAYEHQFC